MGLIKIKKINESYIALISEPNQIKLKIANLLKAHPQNYQFSPKYKAGLWDGFVKYYAVKNNTLIIPYGFLDMILENFSNHKIELYNIEIPKKENFNKKEIDDFIENLNLKYKPRDYQLKAIYGALFKKRGIFEMATGSGKSLTQTIIASYLALTKNKKVVIVVPNVSLVHQFYSDILDYFENSDIDIEKYLHKIYAGQVKSFEKNITITTWQSIYKSSELFADVDCLMVDEVQNAKNFTSKLTDIIIPSSVKAEYKFGFTGSLPKGKDAELALIGSFGKVYTIIKARELIDLGYGTPIEIILMKLNYNKKYQEYFRKYKFSYQQEKKLFDELSSRNKFIAKLSVDLTEKFGNTLILFDKINHGKILLNQIINELGIDLEYEKMSFKDKVTKNSKSKIQVTNFKIKDGLDNVLYLEDLTPKVFLVYGEVSPETREKIRKFAEENKVIIIANYKTFSEGINIKNLHNLILASSTKSSTRIVQSIGRTIRKLDSKEKVRIIDLIDSVETYSKNYMLKHFEERLSIYLEEQHIIKEKNINLEADISELLEILELKEDDTDSFF